MKRTLSLFLATIALGIVASPAASKTDINTAHVDIGKQLSLSVGNIAAPKIVEAPKLGVVVIGKDQKILVYVPNAGKSGLDRIVVSSSKDETKRIRFDIVVGDPSITPSEVAYGRLFYLLFILLVVAIFIEVALSFIFKTKSWQWIETNWTGWTVGKKTLVTLFVSGVTVVVFHLNIFGEVVEAVTRERHVGQMQVIVSYAITTLLIAGGNHTIYELYRKLRIRPPSGGDVGQSGNGSLSVTVARKKAANDQEISVLLNKKYIGKIDADKNRFPAKDNYPVAAGAYRLSLESNGVDDSPVDTEKNIGVETNSTKDVSITL